MATDTLSSFSQWEFVPEDTLQLTTYHSQMEFASGLEADPLPYSPRTDNGVTLVLLCCFVLSSFILARSKKLLSEMIKGFINHRKRANLFTVSTSGEVRFLLLLSGQTCVLGGIVIFNFFADLQPGLMQQIPPHLLMVAYIGICLLYVLFKWMIYSFLGWIFFDKSTTSQWVESYFSLVYCLGFALFPFVLLLVYFNLNFISLVAIGLVLIIFTKTLMIFKCIKLFSDNIFELFLLILYFCALEIMPYFIVYQGVVELNELLVIKF